MAENNQNEAPHLTSADFQSTLDSAGSKPVLVDFFAEWCGPCKLAAPVINELHTEYAGKAVVAKVDVDAQNDLAATHGVMSIPTVIVFVDGKEVERKTGFAGKQGYVDMIENATK